MTQLIRNAKLVLPDSVTDGWIELSDGKIAELGTGKEPGRAFDSILDAEGGYVVPGFVDIHVHGGASSDFRDGTKEAYLNVLRAHLKGGTTTIVPTLSTSSYETMMKSIRVFEEIRDNWNTYEDIPELAGMHLEGPYVSKDQLGAQDKELARLPDKEEYTKLLRETDAIKRWSVACELPGAYELASVLRKRNINVSIGHSDATCTQALDAFQNGFTCVTHLYSSCSIVHRIGPFRVAGLVEAAFLSDDADVEMIGDGIHLPPELLKLIVKIKGPDKIALITDCIRPGAKEAVPEGTIDYDDLEKKHPIILESGVAILPDRKSFAGSIATTSHIVKTAVTKAGVPLHDAVKMASLTPARILGLDKEIGSLEKGKKANLLILDQELSVRKILINGKNVGGNR